MNAKAKNRTHPAVKSNNHHGPLDEELDFLWQECDRGGNLYDLYLGRISRSPVVRSHASGRYFMMAWSRIIEMAVVRDQEQEAALMHA